MVAAPLMTVGVPVQLPKTAAAKSAESKKPVVVDEAHDFHHLAVGHVLVAAHQHGLARVLGGRLLDAGAPDHLHGRRAAHDRRRAGATAEDRGGQERRITLP
jgi:biopolymer transport protein ExbD